jgi:hypothetical protein
MSTVRPCPLFGVDGGGGEERGELPGRPAVPRYEGDTGAGEGPRSPGAILAHLEELIAS